MVFMVSVYFLGVFSTRLPFALAVGPLISMAWALGSSEKARLPVAVVGFSLSRMTRAVPRKARTWFSLAVTRLAFEAKRACRQPFTRLPEKVISDPSLTQMAKLGGPPLRGPLPWKRLFRISAFPWSRTPATPPPLRSLSATDHRRSRYLRGWKRGG